MPKFVANHTIVVVRDRKRTRVEPGTAFDFTAAEAAGINATSPGALRKPVNEAAEAEPEAEKPEAEKPAPSTKASDAGKTANTGRASGRSQGGKPAAEDDGGL